MHRVEHKSISTIKVWFPPCYFYGSLTLQILLAAKAGELFGKHFPFPALPGRQLQPPCPQISKVAQPFPDFIDGLFCSLAILPFLLTWEG